MKSIPVLILLAGAATAQPQLGDAERGRRMAVEICAECHNVLLAPEVERADAPRSFTAIAQDPLYTRAAFKAFFSTPHNQMPDFIFTREQTDDLIAYFDDLRRQLAAD